MQRASAFEVEGLVVEVFPNGTCRVELANGHRLCGFVPHRRGPTSRRIVGGDRVKLSLTPYDLSVGRIVSGKPTDLI